ncbi:hypothetical protein NHX12_033562 [Muraenolepis orangiensis]|uniref:Uncharacterized protein n=1 Tax=Muraenolepis orangiensis TaxID=630683 RepID=A0A9Q0IJS9_9TELE|nr:hypothetical protein NHX12_033562 [Muraenolepis orangiensis]
MAFTLMVADLCLGMAPMYEGGSSKAAAVYQPVQADPGYDGTSFLSGPGDQKGSAVQGIYPLPGTSDGLPPASSPGVSWALPPPGIFSGGDASPSSSYAGYSMPPPEPQFVPGELSRLERTLEDGGYESETQERGFPPPPSPYGVYVEDAGPQALMPTDAGPQALMPMGGSFGYFYPYDWRLLTGQYPPGTYTHVSSSLERGRDDWQENHYLKYDYPASPREEQQFQTFPSASDQSFQLPGVKSGPGDQEEPAYEEANEKLAPY